jgi:formate hydrogenlyase transcriptional activator
MTVVDASLDRCTILIADDNPSNLDVLLKCLSRDNHRVLVAEDGRSAIDRARQAQPDLILLDVMMPELDGFETCKRLRADPTTAHIPIIFMTALGDLDEKVRAFELGAQDYITKPFQVPEVLARVSTQLQIHRLQKSLQVANADLEGRVALRTSELSAALAEVQRLSQRLHAEKEYLKDEIRQQHDHRAIVGSSPALKAVLRKVDIVAASDATVLIYGETGTGKELIARAIHDASRRSACTMVKLNCAAISAGLVESELFGHVKGAFTGAVDKRVGRFELADGGTLFLDEISELPLDTQAKLLRVLQEQEFEPVGSSTSRKVDVRVIAATNRDLEAEVEAGRFRADLYYRLNVFPLELPPLRERRDDIPELVRFFMAGMARKHGRHITNIAPQTLQTLVEHPWPGNIRDLQNTIERAVILCEGETLTLDRPPPGVKRASSTDATAVGSSGQDSLRLDDAERRHIIGVLKQTRGIIEGPRGAAALLNLKPSTARFRIKKLGIGKADYLV